MRHICLAGVLVALVSNLLIVTPNGRLYAQTSTTNPYRVTLGWEKLPTGRTLGIMSGAFPDPDGQHLWLLDRCGGNQCADSDLDPILKFNLDGDLVESFGAGIFAFPHGFYLDHEGFLWVTEGGSHGDVRATLGESMGLGHQVLKLNQRGDVVMRLGTLMAPQRLRSQTMGISGLLMGTGAGIIVSSNSPVMGPSCSK